MCRELYFGIAIEVIGNGSGVGVQMTGVVNPAIGWFIIGLSTLFGLWLIRLGIKKSRNASSGIATAKEQAKKIHSVLINLESDLWVARDDTPEGIDPRENTEVKKVYSDIQMKINELATIINNHDFDNVQWALISLYTRFLEHDANPYKKPFVDELNMAHTVIRRYINKIKG